MTLTEQITCFVKKVSYQNRREFFKCDLEIIVINMKKTENSYMKNNYYSTKRTN